MTRRDATARRQIARRGKRASQRAVPGLLRFVSLTPLAWGTVEDWGDSTAASGLDTGADPLALALDFDGFEDGDLSEWTVNDFQTVQDRVYEGSYAGYSGNGLGEPQASRTLPVINGGAQVEQFEFYWNETTNSYGGGIRLKNSNGNYEAGAATSNPGWDVFDANGNQKVRSRYGTYDRWIRTTLTFDWGAGTFDVTFEDQQNGDTTTVTDRPLVNGVDIATISFENYDSAYVGWLDSSSNLDMWLDNISAGATSGSLTTASKSFTAATKVGLDKLAYTLNGGSIDLTVVGSPGTASEEAVTASLDGASVYTLGQADAHDTYEVDASITSGGGGQSPSLDALTLQPVDSLPALLVWDTQSDWSAFTSSSTTRVSNGSVVLDPAFFDGFEDGDLSEWTVNSASVVQDRVYEGSNAMFATDGLNQPQATLVPSGYSGGGQPSGFQFFFQETSASYGGGFRLVNSNGNYELGLGTDNPEYEVDDGNGVTQVLNPSDAYNFWVRFTVEFDWTNGTYSYDFARVDGSRQATGRGRPLKNGVDIETVQFENYNGGTWGGGRDIEMWVDSISFPTTSGTLTTDTLTFDEATTPDLDAVAATTGVNSSVTLDVTGSPGSGSPETKSVTLDGSQNYDLLWNESHTDFRVTVSLSRSSVLDTAPEVGRVRLKAVEQSTNTETVRWNTASDWDS